jgi:hypothetical protein
MQYEKQGFTEILSQVLISLSLSLSQLCWVGIHCLMPLLEELHLVLGAPEGSNSVDSTQ